MKNIRNIAFCATLFIWPVVVQAGEGEKMLDRFMGSTKSMQADFTQTLRTSDGDVLQQSSGQFYLLRPGKFRWNYAQPYVQQIISDGDHVWVYDVDLRQVTVQKQKSALTHTPMELLQDRARLAESFNIRELGEKDGIYRLQLTSKVVDGDFSNIILGVDKQGLRYMVMHDQFEQTTDIVFEQLKTNTGLAGELFNFVPPEGVDVFGNT